MMVALMAFVLVYSPAKSVILKTGRPRGLPKLGGNQPTVIKGLVPFKKILNG
jgi:hypothetical protein